MSVIVKEIRMPINCCSCPFTERIPPGRTRCLLTCRMLSENYEAPPSMDRPDFCPLIDLGSHGDLIDKDMFVDKYGEWYTEEGTEEGFIGTIKGLANTVPVVLKAEEVTE